MKAMRSNGVKIVLAAALCLTGLFACVSVAQAQTSNIIQDNFTGTTAQLNWQAFNGACLTAGTNVAGSSGGFIPSCAKNTYFTTSPQNDTNQYGLTSNADSPGSGALRLTDAYGNQNGAVIDQTPYPSNLGIQVTFTTYTYGGNKGGTAKDGADGIGFYLLGATSTTASGANTINGAAAVPNLGAFGGSLGYSCSNSNNPHDGMAGAYMGLGMDEYGNFLNSPDNTGTGDQATSVNGGDGVQYQPGRIGLRAYGNVNLATLKAITSASATTYVPTETDVQNTCQNGGTYNWNLNEAGYNLTYTYQPNNALLTPLVATSTTTTTAITGWAATLVTTSHGTTTTTSEPSYDSACGSASTTTTTPVITTNGGGQQSGGGNATAYTGSGLYQMASSTTVGQPTSTAPTTLTGPTHTISETISNKKQTLTCTPVGTSYSTATTTTTTYTFTQQGATNSSPNTSNVSGYTGTGQMYGLVNGQYYPVTFSASPTTITTGSQSATLPDYAAIPNAFYNLPATTPIASETAANRAAATPISYKLQITQSGLLSLWYSWNGGNYIAVLTGQSITNGNAPVPTSFLFGFGGSTGGSNNVHEITCFQVTPSDVSSSSAGLNVQQAGEVKTGTQVYLASYHTNNWWGELTSQNLVINGGVVSISPTVNWDASCVLTGGACTATNTTSGTAQSPSQRVLLSWQDTTTSSSASNTGIQLAWSNLTSTEQGWLNAGDNLGQNRLAYLTGDRSNEIPTTGATGTQVFRDRNSVLGDIIDSGPTWVGPPSAPYPAVWKDLLNPTAVPPENAGTTTYPAFATSNATRLNVVYDGANDGFLHGFEAGSYDSTGNYVSTNNDGKEVLAYMPQAVLQTIHNGTNKALDYSNASYGHNYFTDATPGTGDLFYKGTWHTWLVSGMGPGGNAIFALDITNPTNFSNSNAASLVIGEWNPNTLVCTNNATCGTSMGQSYGTPQIRRLHNGEWGIIFGNGLNSSTGHAGIYVMTFATSATAPNGVVLDQTYFLDTGVGSASNPNGIAYVTPVDLDGDHITDYVYAGDAYGNVWRFDLSNATPANWIVSTYGGTGPTPLFTTPTTKTVTTTPSSGTATTTSTSAPVALTAQANTPNGTTSTTSSGTTTTTVVTNQPITTAVTVVSVSPTATGQPRVMVEFGTGAVVPQSITSGIEYAPGQQALYGVWDWYMGQSGTVNASYAGLIGSSSAPTAQIGLSQLDQQTVTGTYSAAQSGIGQGARTLSNNLLCFAGTTCAGTGTGSAAGTMYGWYMNLPGFNGVSGVGNNNQTEQVIYSPVEVDGAFIVNTVVPANNSPLTCTAQTAQGWTMAVNPVSGGAFQQSFFASSTGQFVSINGSPVSGIALNGTGSPSVVTANNNPYLVTQTVNGAGAVNQINPPGNMYTKRLTWLELH
jgi:type IV pilus assembly protein PilY1